MYAAMLPIVVVPTCGPPTGMSSAMPTFGSVYPFASSSIGRPLSFTGTGLVNFGATSDLAVSPRMTGAHPASLASAISFPAARESQGSVGLGSTAHLAALNGPVDIEAAPCAHMCRMFDAYADSKAGTVSLVLEFCGGGSLQEVVDAGGVQHEGALARIAAHTLRGLAFLHLHRQLHRDIKPGNMLCTTGGHVYKLGDFGIATSLGEEGQIAGQEASNLARTWVGTLVYMSPERLAGSSGASASPAVHGSSTSRSAPAATSGGYGFPSDVWSLGLSLLSIAAGSYPYGGAGYWDLLAAIREKPAPLHILDAAWTTAGVLGAPSPALKAFLKVCLAVNPAERPRAAELLRHPWLLQHTSLDGVPATSWAKGALDRLDEEEFAAHSAVGMPLCDALAEMARSGQRVSPALLARFPPSFKLLSPANQDARLSSITAFMGEVLREGKAWAAFVKYFRRRPAAIPAAAAAAGVARASLRRRKAGLTLDEASFNPAVQARVASLGDTLRAASALSSRATLDPGALAALGIGAGVDGTPAFVTGPGAARPPMSSLPIRMGKGSSPGYLDLDSLRASLEEAATAQGSQSGLQTSLRSRSETMGSTGGSLSGSMRLPRRAGMPSTPSVALPPRASELQVALPDVRVLAVQLDAPPLLMVSLVNDAIEARCAELAASAASSLSTTAASVPPVPPPSRGISLSVGGRPAMRRNSLERLAAGLPIVDATSVPASPMQPSTAPVRAAAPALILPGSRYEGGTPPRPTPPDLGVPPRSTPFKAPSKGLALAWDIDAGTPSAAAAPPPLRARLPSPTARAPVSSSHAAPAQRTPERPVIGRGVASAPRVSTAVQVGSSASGAVKSPPPRASTASAASGSGVPPSTAVRGGGGAVRSPSAQAKAAALLLGAEPRLSVLGRARQLIGRSAKRPL